MNGTELNKYKLISLAAILEAYKTRVSSYLETHNIATCFVYFSPEKMSDTDDYFQMINEYDISFSRLSLLGVSTLFQIGMEIVGFSNDCSYKLTAKIMNNEILINTQHDALFPIEIEKGKQIGNTNRTRHEQNEIENHLRQQNPELRKKGENFALENFTDFAKKTHLQIIALLEAFDRCIKLCHAVIQMKQKDSTPANLPEIERIHSVLSNGYIQEPIETFLAIFQNDYSGPKIIWLKDGAELRFFLDRIVVKITNAKNINQWADKRFTLLVPPSNFIRYIGDVKHKNSLYLRLIDGNEKSNPIYKLSKGF
jgi:hypothetical protein